jgi:hypothetical protein
MTTVAPARRVQITPTDIAEAMGLPKGRGVISIKEAATYLDEGENQVAAWCRTSKLQAYKGGAGGRTSTWRITLKALAAFVNAQDSQR